MDTLRVSPVRTDPAAQLQELGGGMFVPRRWMAKGEMAQILKLIVQFIEAPVPTFPVLISQREENRERMY